MAEHLEEAVTISSQGQKMPGNLFIPGERAPFVLLSHGLESSKDGNKWLIMAPHLNDAGFGTLRFSYRGCGEESEKSEGEFEDTTLTGRIADYRAAIDFLQERKVDIGRLGVIGSSFGGMVALAARDERVKAMAVMSTPCNIAAPEDGAALKHALKKGYIELESGRRLRINFYQDLRRYDIRSEVQQIGCPLLIIQGSQDTLVPITDAHELYDHASEPKRLEIVEGADHVFSEPEHLERVLNLCLKWLKQHL